jgi:hypothetical protein
MMLVKGVHGILQWVEIPGSIRHECLCQQGLFWMESMTTAREAAKSFQDLIVWRKAHELVLEVYRLTEQFPQREIYGLSHQLRRAAERLHQSHSDSWLLTPDSRIPQGYQGRQPLTNLVSGVSTGGTVVAK